MKSAVTCEDLVRFNALLTPGESEDFPPLARDFCFTDIVMGLWNFPEGLASKGSCSIWLVIPSAGTSEILFKFTIDQYGRQVHLNSGVFCPKGSHLSANSGVFVVGTTALLRVLLTGFYC